MEFNTQESFAATTQGILYLVPTPIGNLDDMTFRAVKILQEVDLIAAEDTRNTQKLLNHFEITTKQISFHEHNATQRIPELLQRLQAGLSIAQVSDAGMPSISDPGHDLVIAAIAADINVVPLPGANAGLTALIASGVSPQPFLFWGFLPRKQGERETELDGLKMQHATLIFYEAPHRLQKTLQSLLKIFGGEREISICRELTKRYEQFARGTLETVIDWLATQEIRGEFVLIVAGNTEATEIAAEVPATAEELIAQIDARIAAGDKPNVAIKQIAKQQHLARQQVYNTYHQITERQEN